MGTPEGTFDTTLHEAVRCSDIDDVRVALQQGYDPNLIGLFQWSSLHEAAYNGDVEILKLLLDKKGDTNKPDHIHQMTAMHYATEQGHIGCLKLLVAAGGRYDLKDDSGRDCLDMATPAGRKILEKLKMRALMLRPEDTDEEDSSSSLAKPADDSVSLTSSQSSLTQEAALGYLHMSVEYHAAKSSLKIRIWQVTDLFLPPSNTSMIHSIYVKSFLLPDKKKESKRKTEEIKVENSEGHIHIKKQKNASMQHVFTPSNFKFTRALEYSGMNTDIIKEKYLSLEVCITQRYSHRSFLIGMVKMPLKNAVRKIVKERIALLPCMNYTIPATMKVYSASDLNISNQDVFYSNPNFSMSIPSDVDSSTSAHSNPNLRPDQYSPSTEVDMNNKYEAAPIVPKLDLHKAALDESGYSSEVHISLTSDLESPDSISSRKFTDLCKRPGGGDESKVRVINVLESVKETTVSVTRYHEGIPITDLDEVEDVEIVSTEPHSKRDGKTKKSDTTQVGSRPETPTWDYYDMPDEVVAERTESPWKEGAAPVVLPMMTTMHVPQIGDATTATDKQTEKARRKLFRKKSPKPGRAIPLVPEIIVTNVDQDNSMKSVNKHAEGVPSIRVEKPEASKSVAISIDTNQNVSEERDKKSNGKDEVSITVPVVKKKDSKDGKKSKALESDKNLSNDKSLRASLKSRLKKLKKSKEKDGELKVHKKHVKEISASSLKDQSPVSQETGPINFRHSGEVRMSTQSSTDLSSLTSIKTEGDSDMSNTSFVVDMESLSFHSNDSHIVELDEDVSITELPEDSELFSHMSEVSMPGADVESVTDYELPERVSPTKYMIPMQVYMEDDTSCDESLATDVEPSTEL